MNGKVALVIALVILVIPAVAVFNYMSRAGAVVSHEIDPAVVQAKYEWFKDAHAALDAKKASIEVYQKRMDHMDQDYNGTKRQDWAKDDRAQYNIWQDEVSGLKASFNTLAATYNSEMAKWNWRFANVGGLPQGATEVLPREYIPYATE